MLMQSQEQYRAGKRRSYYAQKFKAPETIARFEAVDDFTPGQRRFAAEFAIARIRGEAIPIEATLKGHELLQLLRVA